MSDCNFINNIKAENIIENNDKSFDRLLDLQLLIQKESSLKKICKKKILIFL